MKNVSEETIGVQRLTIEATAGISPPEKYFNYFFLTLKLLTI
jgi:hypothetical protein